MVADASKVKVDSCGLPWRVHFSELVLPDGPYIIETATGKINKAGCQHGDTHAAFIVGPSAVQSRLYNVPTQAYPLAGVSVSPWPLLALPTLELGADCVVTLRG